MNFFIADTHFSHTGIVKYCNRPFKDVNEMDETIITNWNKIVTPKDIVYHLGDFSFSHPMNYVPRLNGKIHLILGNHDFKRFNQFKKSDFLSVSTLKEIKINDTFITLCHYAMRVWSKSHYNSWHLHGHSHGCLPPQGKSFDVGVDSNNFIPLSFEQVKSKMDTLTDNFNWVKKLPGYNSEEP